MDNSVAGIILAAGESSRMGRDKALLPLGEENFVEHLIHLFGNLVSPLVVVLGHHADAIEARITAASSDRPIVILRNPNYTQGQLSSLQVALRYLMDQPCDGALVALVDHPAITRSVVELLLARFAKSRAPVLIPTFQGRRGHPVLFARRLFQELLDAPVEEGARVVVRRHAAEVEHVSTDEEGVLLDVDLPADYERLLKREKGVGRTE